MAVQALCVRAVRLCVRCPHVLNMDVDQFAFSLFNLSHDINQFALSLFNLSHNMNQFAIPLFNLSHDMNQFAIPLFNLQIWTWLNTDMYLYIGLGRSIPVLQEPQRQHHRSQICVSAR